LQHKAGFGEIGLAFRLAKVEEKRAGNVVLMQCNGAPQCQQGLPAGRKRARGAALKVGALSVKQGAKLHKNHLLEKMEGPFSTEKAVGGPWAGIRGCCGRVQGDGRGPQGGKRRAVTGCAALQNAGGSRDKKTRRHDPCLRV